MVFLFCMPDSESQALKDIAQEMEICSVSKKATALPALAKAFVTAVSEGWPATKSGQSVTIRLPTKDFVVLFKGMAVSTVMRGLLDLGHAKKVLGEDVVALTAHLDKIQAVGRKTGHVYNRKEYQKAFFGEAWEEEAEFRKRWTTVFGVDENVFPEKCSVLAVVTLTGEAKLLFEDLATQAAALPDGDADFSTASATLVFRREEGNRVGFDQLVLLYCFVVTLLRRALRGRDPDKPLVFVKSRLSPDHVPDDIWCWLQLAEKEAASLEVQLVELSKVKVITHFIGVEREKLMQAYNGRTMPVSESNRVRNLDALLALLEKPGIAGSTAEFARVEREANASQEARVLKGLETGPPKDPRRKAIKSIPLRSAFKGKVRNVLDAVGMATVVYGHLHKTTVLQHDAFELTRDENVHRIKVEDLSNQGSQAVTGSRCWLMQQLQQKLYSYRTNEDGAKQVVKRSNNLVGADKPTIDKAKFGVYMPTVMLRVVYKAPVMPRGECLKDDGTGGIVVIDEGM